MANPDAKWFDERPVRTITCARCRGAGTVVDAYALKPTDRAVIDAPNDAIRAYVIGSFGIFEVCQEAVEIATRADQAIAFRFNDFTVVIRKGDDPDKVARDWWQKAYNETPEETAARR